ncbi:MAG: hybrid sensor histidine kinase/response regulator [Acidobacteria bacterium]|nr:hybrid sensor histidine kinase/response regulator [Acidobacteriota bacterium]
MNPNLLALGELQTVPLLFVAKDGQLRGANTAFRSRFGEVHGRTLFDLVADPPDLVAETIELCLSTRSAMPARLRFLSVEGARAWNCTGARVGDDGDPREPLIALRLAPAADAAQRFLLLNQKIEELSHEIGRRRDVEARLREQAQQLADVDRRKDEFLAQLGHELRNPLAAIRSTLDVIRAGGRIDPRRALEILDRQSRHLTRLVDDLLDVARINHGRFVLQREVFDLAQAIALAVETSRPALEAAEQHLEIEVDRGRPLLVDGDPARLAQVIANLLHNAAKFGPPSGAVGLRAWTDGVEVGISVRDEGVGIAEADRELIFRPFMQRAPDAVGRRGLGLGLALARRLVELHGGSIEVHSSPGCGAEFVIALPAAPGPVPAPVPQAEAVAAVAPSLRVLIVDDNADAAEALAALLDMHGLNVRWAYDGRSALVVAREFLPEVVLLDIQLPDIDGYALARTMRHDPALANATLVAVTGFGGHAAPERSAAAGFNHHIVKPLELDDLLRLLNDLAPRPTPDRS